MVMYAIVESEAGLMVSELDSDVVPEEGAVEKEGVVVDPGPYKTYEEAYDALLAMEEEEEDEDLL